MDSILTTGENSWTSCSKWMSWDHKIVNTKTIWPNFIKQNITA